MIVGNAHAGKRMVFVTVEDEHGHANLVVYADVGARDRPALVAARLLVADGRVERETERAKVRITHLIFCRLVDRSDLLDGLGLVDGGGGEWAERALGRADEVRRPERRSRSPAPAEAPLGRTTADIAPISRAATFLVVAARC